MTIYYFEVTASAGLAVIQTRNGYKYVTCGTNGYDTFVSAERWAEVLRYWTENMYRL